MNVRDYSIGDRVVLRTRWNQYPPGSPGEVQGSSYSGTNVAVRLDTGRWDVFYNDDLMPEPEWQMIQALKGIS